MKCSECPGVAVHGTTLCQDHLELQIADALPKWALKQWYAGRINLGPMIERAVKIANAPGKAGDYVRTQMDRLGKKVWRRRW